MGTTSKVAVIGSGFAGLSAAAYLSKAGCDVTVYEKNAGTGGRARQLDSGNGYLFDMGPSWYWMPGVFERFFNDFGYTANNFYALEQLDPGFKVVFGQDDELAVPADFDALCTLFESIEPGAAQQLKAFLKEAAFKYKTGMEKLVYKPGLSIAEFADIDLIKGLFKLQVFTSFSTHVRKYFKHPHLVALMDFPVLFLGATPADTPALYSLMNYAGLKLGTWYLKGGFASVIAAMQQIVEKQGVKIVTAEPVTKVNAQKGMVKGLTTESGLQGFDAIIAAADYNYVEQQLLDKNDRNYDEAYWESRVMAPSSLIFYLGVNKKVPGLIHHNLFFDADLDAHAKEIYETPRWPLNPLYYVCCPSKTDGSVAPEGHENLFILMPLAPGIEDNEELRERYFTMLMDRLEHYTKFNIREHIDYKKSYCIKDFVADYHSYKGNAYGLANTLKQTAILKPSIKNSKLHNLFYAGQLTVPGPGVPPSIISGNLAAQQVLKYLKKR